MAFNGRAVAARISENAERVRRVVPAEYRAERTPVVYDTARYMYEADSGLTDEQVALVFMALAWASEQQHAAITGG